ncbi:NAD(P)-dependent oxidoreductase [Paenibacillus sp. Z6-24]
MRILLLGATGRVGRIVLQHLLREQHEVHVLVRSQEKLQEQLTEADADPELSERYHLPTANGAATQQERLHMFTGSVLEPDNLVAALQGVDAVISAIGTDGTDTLSASTRILIPLLEQQGIRRLITIGTAGILQSRTEPGLYRYQSSESRRRSTRAAEEHRSMYEQLQSSSLDWTIICPTYLPDGNYTGNYRVERDILPEGGSRISTADTAGFACRQLQDQQFLRVRVGIAD